MAGKHFPRMDGQGRRRGVEWPSIALCAAVYGGFLRLTFFHARLPVVLVILVGASLLALQTSMQHEFIHGHPTPWRRLNRALAAVPLTLWLPFESYRMTHLVHHCDEALTDPFDDPESFYWSPEAWARLGPLGQAFVRFQTTLAGRLLIGPAWSVSRYLVTEGRALLAGNRSRGGSGPGTPSRPERSWFGSSGSAASTRSFTCSGWSIRARRSCCFAPSPSIAPPTASSSGPQSSRMRRSSGSCSSTTTSTRPITSVPWCRGTSFPPGTAPTGPARRAERRPRLRRLRRSGPPLPLRAARCVDPSGPCGHGPPDGGATTFRPALRVAPPAAPHRIAALLSRSCAMGRKKCGRRGAIRAIRLPRASSSAG